ncbi:hypothetical protein [Roseivivax marinus]|uniref:hypothetical protein n=1 Tax=Roseivivax marinus TaxID=1379903 RepID=UPI00273ED0F7|nr:hypothetical protein [Roseivivax marinus]
MARIVAMILALALLGACGSTGNDGSNPLDEDEQEDTGGDTGGDGSDDGSGDPTTPIESDRELPPGTAQPTPNNSIVRYEAQDDNGGGYARNIRYNSDDDTFEVDNLAFDGDNVYQRGGQPSSQNDVGSLGPFAVYESDVNSVDPVTGTVVDNLAYRAIYGVSTSGQTEFAIVRTGDYAGYGFGGFVYQRNGGDGALILPTEGDAAYSGDYAGIRVFDGEAGLEYVTGDATMQIDFKDFNESRSGVQFFVRNRRLYDINGADLTDEYIAALQADNPGLDVPRDGAGNAVLPNVLPVVEPGVADANGEIVQSVFTRIQTADGPQELSEGQYYAIMSGENAEEITGVLVVEGDDPRSNATFQETGGFIVYRQ